MTSLSINLDTAYVASEDVIARDMDGELLIVPLVGGMGDIEDAIFSLNETGRAIWDRLDGRATLRQIAAALSDEYAAPIGQIESDVQGLLEELIKRKMVVETDAR